MILAIMAGMRIGRLDGLELAHSRSLRWRYCSLGMTLEGSCTSTVRHRRRCSVDLCDAGYVADLLRMMR